MTTAHKTLSCLVMLTAVLTTAAGPRAEEISAASKRPYPGVSYRLLVRHHPRILRIHVLRVDLSSPGIELGVAAAPDPDGDGPAETILASPLAFTRSEGFIAGVNANTWHMVTDPESGKKRDGIPGAACDIYGWAVMGGNEISPPQHYCSFWLDAEGAPSISEIKEPPAAVRLAVSGFGLLVNEGAMLPHIKNTQSKLRHPRTALGMSRDRRFLILAVVDGRQPGYSEGLTEAELAGLMLDLGAHQAFNLDGGGSSVMMLREHGAPARIVNRPSAKSGPRPIAVLLKISKSPGTEHKWP